MRTDTAVVITSAICPAKDVPFTRLTDANERLRESLCALVEWSSVTSVKKFVLCDNTAPAFSFGKVIAFFHAKDKELEVLTFQGDRQKVASQGKGYGEGEIVRHVLHNSRLLRTCDYFFKITGKVFVRNFEQIADAHLNDGVVFETNNKRIGLTKVAAKTLAIGFPNSRFARGMTNTCFYKCERAFFERHLLDAYFQVDDLKKNYLERVYYNILCRKWFTEMKMSPALVGISGTSGKSYCGLRFSKDTIQEAERLLEG